MLVFREHINDSELIIWQVDETLEELKEISLHHYDHELESISNEVRKKESILSRYLLETLLGKAVEVRYEASGKPVMDGVNFSISHTKNYVAVIVGNGTVGVDIEHKSDRIFRVTEKFMSKDELETLTCFSNTFADISKNAEKTSTFSAEAQKFALLCWCAKETMFKMIDEIGVDFTKMNCKIDSEKIILSYKNADFILKYMDFPDFFVVFS